MSLRSRIVDIVRNNPGQTAPQVAANLDDVAQHPGSVTSLVSKLVASGTLTRGPLGGLTITAE